ncbi:hypothetical protein KGM_213481 [Danaus plexippus plexippus]|uniref:Secreted protein n=1 Tax=Danaus plexippus plexippus TaxID=278856 RepID=A0A212FJI2_DANPL|nr:hypothetical protein KGM_213481 [Danaus plexippus plexippus]
MEATRQVSAHWLSTVVLVCSFFTSHSLDTKHIELLATSDKSNHKHKFFDIQYHTLTSIFWDRKYEKQTMDFLFPCVVNLSQLSFTQN